MWVVDSYDSGVVANTPRRVRVVRELIFQIVQAANDGKRYAVSADLEFLVATMLVCDADGKPAAVMIGTVPPESADDIAAALRPDCEDADRDDDERPVFNPDLVDWMHPVPLTQQR